MKNLLFYISYFYYTKIIVEKNIRSYQFARVILILKLLYYNFILEIKKVLLFVTILKLLKIILIK